MAKQQELSQDELDAIAVKGAFENYNKNKGKTPTQEVTTPPIPEIPSSSKISVSNPSDFQSKMMEETDPDLIISYEEVKLPSNGIFYADGLKAVNIEYLTSKDEDIMTTPSLIENGTVLDILLARKIKTKGVDVSRLLSGDKSALILFLRASSYGHEYEVQVPDPRTNTMFNEIVDLRKFAYKEIKDFPDDLAEFMVEIPMRKKVVKFRLLTSGEEDSIAKNAETYQEAYSNAYNEYNTMKLKANITQIGDNRDRSYIDRFVDAMPARDAYTIRRRILDVTPEVDMTYEFTAPDGFKFNAQLLTGPDFFFPSN